MTIGPAEYIVVAFPGTEFSGAIVPELRALVDTETIAILDLIVVSKAANGDVSYIEVEELEDFSELDSDVGGLISMQDIEHAAGLLGPEMAAALIVWIDLWAQPFADAVRNAGGVLVEGARIPHEILSPAVQHLDPAR
ncbi:DUF6325 family protein [Leifsonia sp. NPDC058248]|uniref:DUF6325 family protein n=1 Tax=Leifsonia sp. NPDC058248 TaxID=3346402 RepID=UPI0036D7BBCA